MALIGVIGWGIVACGPVAGLAIADAPLAVATCVGYALFGLAGAVVRLRRRWRSRGQGMRLPPPLTGWRLRAAAAASALFYAAGLAGALRGLVAPTAVLASLGVLSAGWCAVSVREDEAAREEQGAWSAEELAALDDAVNLEQFLLDVPVKQLEEPFE